MDADLDLLLIAVFCTTDDLLPKRAENARRRITDAEVITLCIAQAMLGIASDEQFLAVARHRLAHLFPALPERSAFHKRRLRLSGSIEALIAEFARHSPGFYDDVVLVDSTPVEGVETRRRSQLADAADYGYCASHSRLFWGFRLHALFAMDGTPRALALTSPKSTRRPSACNWSRAASTSPARSTTRRGPLPPCSSFRASSAPAPTGALLRFDYRGDVDVLIRTLAALRSRGFSAERESLTEAFFAVYEQEGRT